MIKRLARFPRLCAAMLALSCRSYAVTQDLGTLELGEKTVAASATISADGGRIEVPKGNSPLAGFVLEVPKGAFKQERRITVSYQLIKGHSFSKVNPCSPLMRIEGVSGYADDPLSIKIPAGLKKGGFALPFFYLEAEKRLESSFIPTGIEEGFINAITRTVDLPFFVSSPGECSRIWYPEIAGAPRVNIESAMALIPAGEFWMGSPDNDVAPDERPRHRVYLDAFYMDNHEVTKGEYQKFADSAGRDMRRQFIRGDDDDPVVNVTWNDAKAYCKWAGKRLPTEAEWEKAARGGSDAKYGFGDSVGELAAYAWYKANSAGSPQPVGQKKPNRYGLYDMHGNVLEWVSDWYDADYYKTSPKRNPRGPRSGRTRLIRGGSWGADANSCRAAFRGEFHSGNKDLKYNIGFRCVGSEARAARADAPPAENAGGAARGGKPFGPYKDVYEDRFDALLKLNPQVASLRSPELDILPFDKSSEFLSDRDSPRFMFAPGVKVFNPDRQIKKAPASSSDMFEEYHIPLKRSHSHRYSGDTADLTGVIDLFLDLPLFKTTAGGPEFDPDDFQVRMPGKSITKLLEYDLFLDVVQTSRNGRVVYNHQIVFKSKALRNGRLAGPMRTPEHFKELIDTVWHTLKNHAWASVKKTRLTSDARFIKYDYQFQYCANWHSYHTKSGHVKGVPRKYYRNAYRFVLDKNSGKVFLLPVTVSESGEKKSLCRIVDLSDSICYLIDAPQKATEGTEKQPAPPLFGDADDENIRSRCCAAVGGSWNTQNQCCIGADYNPYTPACAPFRNCSRPKYPPAR